MTDYVITTALAVAGGGLLMAFVMDCILLSRREKGRARESGDTLRLFKVAGEGLAAIGTFVASIAWGTQADAFELAAFVIGSFSVGGLAAWVVLKGPRDADSTTAASAEGGAQL